MTDPRQLRLPFDNQPRPRRGDPVMAEVLHRLVRLESRLVQLMLHSGMTTDGRAPLPPTQS